MAWDPPWDTAIHGSHAPGVGAGEPRASAATRRVEGAPAAAAAHGDGPDVLGRAVEALEELRNSLQMVRPETVVGWHRQGVRRYWAWKSQRRRGRPAIRGELRDLIRRGSRANPLLYSIRPESECRRGDSFLPRRAEGKGEGAQPSRW